MKLCNAANNCGNKIHIWEYACRKHRKYNKIDIAKHTEHNRENNIPEELWTYIIYNMLDFKELSCLAKTCTAHHQSIINFLKQQPYYCMTIGTHKIISTHVKWHPCPIDKRYMLTEPPYDIVYTNKRLVYFNTKLSLVTGKPVIIDNTFEYVIININSLKAIGVLMKSIKNSQVIRKIYILGRDKQNLSCKIIEILNSVNY